jgi:hypothetical protein
MHTLKLYKKSGDEINEIEYWKHLKFDIKYNQESDSIVKFELTGPFQPGD